MKAFIAVVALFFASQVPSFGALNAYLKLTGQKQGAIKGNTADGTIPVFAFFSPAIAQTELDSGKMTQGHRKWSSVLFHISDPQALAKLKTSIAQKEPVQIDLVVNQVGANGKISAKYTVHFSNAIFQSMKNVVVSNMPQTEIAFIFTKITWTWVQGGITAMDDWDQVSL
jgi:type VI secretion system secreted protein Hcp